MEADDAEPCVPDGAGGWTEAPDDDFDLPKATTARGKRSSSTTTWRTPAQRKPASTRTSTRTATTTRRTR